ncbi:MAG: outer membrane lipoprotein carrier protein LolA [Planctomycetes bacterium]|nr:outer membrane lipoprotein carrier protein LolA [Planctomycetota bacterium]
MRFRLALVWWCGGLAAQTPPPSPPAPPPAAVVAAGEALLRAHGERSRGLRVLVADYEQTRTTALAREPLRSRGRFLFVRQPACIVFHATAPRASIVRLTGSVYEVFRPQQQRLERFHLDGPELAQGLFAAVGGDTERLLAEFAVTACGPDPADPQRTRITLQPRRPAVRERVRELAVLLRQDGGALAAIAYRDPAGDLVEIELRAPVVDPDPAPSAEFEVPAGTRIVEHAAPPRRDGSADAQVR